MNETTPKRSWFAPIVLVLLVFSLMGNVFMYSKNLQLEQRARIHTGERIIMSAWNSRQHVDAILEEVNRLIGTDNMAERIKAKQGIGLAFRSSEGLSEFIGAAQLKEPRQLEDQRRTADEFISEVELSLRSIANDDQPLTEQERRYLKLIQETYTLLQQQIREFNVSEASRQNALRTEHGGPWIALAYKMLAIINGPESLFYADNKN